MTEEIRVDTGHNRVKAMAETYKSVYGGDLIPQRETRMLGMVFYSGKTPYRVNIREAHSAEVRRWRKKGGWTKINSDRYERRVGRLAKCLNRASPMPGAFR